MGSLSDLFKFKKQIDIVDPNTGEVMSRPWIRVLGEDDLKEAYRWARIASSERRAKLRDTESVEYRDEIAQLDGVPKENLVAIILAAREQEFSNEAQMTVVRKELPKLEDITERADAPSLEDQEKLDRLTEEVDKEYETELQEYVNTKIEETGNMLMERPQDEILKFAKGDLANIEAMEVFVSELNQWKGYLGTFDDKECKIKSFDSIEDFRDSHGSVKNQVISAYQQLELGGDDVKK